MNWRFFIRSQSKKGILFLLLAAGVFCVLGFQKETYKETQGISTKQKPTLIQSTVIPSPSQTKEIYEEEAVTSTPTPASVLIKTTSVEEQSQVTNKTESTVHVSVSGGEAFDITMPENSNQCDVLTKAQSEGKIHDLSLKFDSNLGSYAVHKINGLGKDNGVWWTYSVNGQDPPKGCSFIKANHGDQVSWNYIGS